MIPSPLLDRMEIISIAGYITDEKMHIARDYLEKYTREASGIKPKQVHAASQDSFEKTESPRKMYQQKKN
jgi:Lon-like ATP-dependent protease